MTDQSQAASSPGKVSKDGRAIKLLNVDPF